MSDRIERIPKSRVAEEPLAGKIAVMCWCEKSMWHVPIEWVMAGKAPSCGPKCNAD